MAGNGLVVLMLNEPDQLQTNIVTVLDLRLIRMKAWENQT